MKEKIVFAAYVLVTVVVLFALFTGLFLLAGNIECGAKTKDMGVPHKYHLIAGCMVEQYARWVPVENWQGGPK